MPIPNIEDIDDLIDEFDVGPLNAENYPTPTQNVRGGYDVGTPESIVLSPVAVHNVSGTDLDQVPEADRNSEVVQFYTRGERTLYVADKGRAASVINYRSERYRVVRIRDFELQGRVWCAFGALEDRQAKP